MAERSVDQSGALPSPERMNSEALYQARLGIVEADALDGAFGEPKRFLAAVEQEIYAVEVPPGFDRSAAGQRVLQEGLNLPDNLDTVQDVPVEERASLLDYYRQEAREYVAAIPAANADEEERRATWLADIEQFDVTDVINYRLYKEFSRPTLGDTKAPSLAPYEDMGQYGEQQGWIEFRFGKAGLQRGYYDDDNVTEYRTTPCPPSEQVTRDAQIRKRLSEIASEHGVVVTYAKRQLNVSLYERDGEPDGQWMPKIGQDLSHQEATLAAVSGLSAAIEDGAWIGEEIAHNGDHFIRLSREGVTPYVITTQRDTLRVQNGYIELREQNIQESTAHGLLWMTVAMSYGMQTGTARLAEDGYGTAELVLRPIVHRTDAYDKELDIAMQRAFEQSTISDDGALDLSEKHIINHGEGIMRSLLHGRAPKEAWSQITFFRAFMPSLVIGADGRVSFDAEAYRTLHKELATRYSGTQDDTEVMGLADDNIIEMLDAYFARDAMRVEFAEVVNAHPRYRRNEPDIREQTWLESPIIHHMYGDMASQYGHQVFEVARENYTPIDTTDPNQVMALLQQATRHRHR